MTKQYTYLKMHMLQSGLITYLLLCDFQYKISYSPTATLTGYTEKKQKRYVKIQRTNFH